jgi:hypothetical protein
MSTRLVRYFQKKIESGKRFPAYSSGTKILFSSLANRREQKMKNSEQTVFIEIQSTLYVIKPARWPYLSTQLRFVDDEHDSSKPSQSPVDADMLMGRGTLLIALGAMLG